MRNLRIAQISCLPFPFLLCLLSVMNPRSISRYNNHGTSRLAVVEGGPVSALLTICDPVSCCWCCAVLDPGHVTGEHRRPHTTTGPATLHTLQQYTAHLLAVSWYIFNTKFKYKIDK